MGRRIEYIGVLRVDDSLKGNMERKIQRCKEKIEDLRVDRRDSG